MRSKPGPNWLWRRRERAVRFARAKWLSQMLLRTLGGQCATCCEENMSLLTVDHIDGVTYDRYKLRYDRRVSKYIEEYVTGVRLRCLCIVCNGRFGRSTLREPGEDTSPPLIEDGDDALPDAPF